MYSLYDEDDDGSEYLVGDTFVERKSSFDDDEDEEQVRRCENVLTILIVLFFSLVECTRERARGCSR